MRVETEAIRFKADAKLIQFIEEKLQKLDHFFSRIQKANVVLKLENSGKVRDKITEVRLQLPGETLIASATSKTFESAALDAINTLKRQLKKYKDKMTERARQ